MAIVATSLPSSLVVHSADPLCAGPDPAALVDDYITPAESHFVRNHGDVPDFDEATYQLTVDGFVETPLRLSLLALAGGFERHAVTTTLQCAGNRRTELDRIRPLHDQVLWGGDAVGTAIWSGVRLADVLARAGVEPTATHVWFEGLDRVQLPDETTIFGGSIDLDRARAADVILAFEMNGAPLPPLHGAPLRVVVPGYIGARSVKWLSRIHVSDRPSANHFQAVSYLWEMPGNDAAPAPIEHCQLNSFICIPMSGAAVSSRAVRISGYATPGGGTAIERMEFAVDGGPWQAASLIDNPQIDAWVRWKADVDLEPGDHTFTVRATDSSGATQPADMVARWNPKGYMNDASHVIDVRVSKQG